MLKIVLEALVAFKTNRKLVVVSKMLISNLYSILSIIIVLRAQVRACNDNNYEQLAMAQDSDDYLSNNYYGLLFKPWPFHYYYEQNTFGKIRFL